MQELVGSMECLLLHVGHLAKLLDGGLDPSSVLRNDLKFIALLNPRWRGTYFWTVRACGYAMSELAKQHVTTLYDNGVEGISGRFPYLRVIN